MEKCPVIQLGMEIAFIPGGDASDFDFFHSIVRSGIASLEIRRGTNACQPRFGYFQRRPGKINNKRFNSRGDYTFGNMGFDAVAAGLGG